MFEWYFLFNKDTFESLNIPSFKANVVLKGIGLKTILITKGNLVSVRFDDYLLPIGLNDKNPFRFGNYAVFLDESSDVWLGVYSEV